MRSSEEGDRARARLTLANTAPPLWSLCAVGETEGLAGLGVRPAVLKLGVLVEADVGTRTVPGVPGVPIGPGVDTTLGACAFGAPSVDATRRAPMTRTIRTSAAPKARRIPRHRLGCGRLRMR